MIEKIAHTLEKEKKSCSLSKVFEVWNVQKEKKTIYVLAAKIYTRFIIHITINGNYCMITVNN